jgi:murein DD-endopeptidase MepM/ murein hydrolase activator NlpD
MEKPISSPLLEAANKIINLDRSTSVMKKTQRNYQDFLRFMDIETQQLTNIKFNDKKLKKALKANITSTFGNAGNLLSGLASGALDAGSFVGDFFGRDKKQPPPKTGKPIQKGGRVRISGVRALGVLTPLLAGLDFAQGLSQGESVGKAGAGAVGSAAGAAAGAAAGGALAGAITAGMIGQGLVPIPGLGFVLGAAVGGLGAFAGGYLADRAYEAATKEGKQKTTVKLKQEEQRQKQLAIEATRKVTFSEVLDKFDNVVTQFQRTTSLGTFGTRDESSKDVNEQISDSEEVMENDQYGDRDTSSSGLGGTMQDLEASGGSLPSSKLGSRYGMRSHPIRGGMRMHRGNDYPMPSGTPVSVIQPGVVANAGFVRNGYGNQVKVDHPGGISSFYAHLNSVNVRPGQQITPGTVIGTVGSTGQSTGPHLHFEVDVNGKTTDPTPYQDRVFRFGGNIRVKPTVKPQQNVAGNPITQQKSEPISRQDLSNMPTDRLRGMMDPARTGASDPTVFAAATQARESAELQGLSGEDLERKVLISSIEATQRSRQSYISPPPTVYASTTIQKTIPQQIQQYPTYNLPQSSITLIPISQGGNNQTPMVISSPGGSETIVLPGPTEGQVLNSLMKNILLTSLSST